MTRLIAMLVAACSLVGLAGCDNGTAPSPIPQVMEGSIDLRPLRFDVVLVDVSRNGTFSSNVNWNDIGNNIDSAILRGACTVFLIQAEVVGCREVDALAFDSSLDRPSVVAAPVTPGAHTVVLLNLGPEADTLSYRIEIN